MFSRFYNRFERSGYCNPAVNMSGRVIREIRDPLESLERMLNRTTLTTQRVQHDQIIKLGGRMLEVKADDSTAERDKAIQVAIEGTEARATRELRAALKRLKNQKDAERARALQTQAEYFERHAQRLAEQRDKAEEERIRDLKRKFQLEKEDALVAQLEESEAEKERAVRAACDLLREDLANQFVMERDRAVATALEVAAEGFRRKMKEELEKKKQACREEAEREAAKTALLHKAELDKAFKRYSFIKKMYKRELVLRIKAEEDFRNLQTDYQRFLDNTDGRFHSDYLIKLRHERQNLAELAANIVGNERVVQLHIPDKWYL
ncbi:reticulocyte-binding protein 2 homolog a-like [Gigantopelta aegis]|uniref:reticulocyte-binding protein 2 homolog a-like n=1 Tax=Gigantopelta aegis TaxID=1735272 RepID=UPI001B88B813|nr:reticulocyte-binding protein 2 homolog a-like [Gigantopelta aegis]